MDKQILIFDWKCVDLPTCSPGTRVGIQRDKEVLDAQLLPNDSLNFRFEVTVKPEVQDFAGSFVHGKRGERFVYLVWSAPFQSLGRSKIGLNTTLPWQLVEDALAQGKSIHATIRLSNAKGQPAFASLKPEMVQWRIG